jgi:S-formylglutathione hydrolase
MKALASHKVFGGTLTSYSHESTTTHCLMRMSVFIPPVPTGAAVIFLSGLTCTEDNFTTKAGAYRTAAQLGLIIIAPDTSPRGPDVPDDDSISLGKGAGFYLNATRAPWSKNYHMYSYISEELPKLLIQHFPIKKFGLAGHSMGGGGALVIALRNRHLFASVSVFAPVCTPSLSGWGPAAFTAYLGEDKSTWADFDATRVMQDFDGPLFPTILIDQGLSDSAYLEGRLNPEAFVAAAQAKGQKTQYRTFAGYDHGYYFIQSFIDDHLHHHAQHLS